MSEKAKRVLIIFDLLLPLPEHQYPDYFGEEDWRTQRDVKAALEKAGHCIKLLGIHNELAPFFESIKSFKPDLIFNLSEAFDSNRSFEPHVAALFELLKIPYTGAKAERLAICKDKGLTKKILTYHDIRVPKFLISRLDTPLKKLGTFPYPAFIKPLGLEASEGISQMSFVSTEKEALERCQFIHDKFKCDVIIEEYIEGREIYVSILGNSRLQVFPPRELFFKDVPDSEPKFATFKAKWDDNYRKKWGITTGPAKSFAEGIEDKILATSKKIYQALQMNGYGRIDLRIRADGEIVFIEANPNPAISRLDDFSLSAQKAGVDYKSLITKIVDLAA